MVLALFMLAGCGGAVAPAAPSTSSAAGSQTTTAPTPQRQVTPVRFLLGFLADANQAPFYLALDRGYYKDQGLDVTITPGKGSAITAEQVAAGQYDIGQTDLTAMALVRAKGAPIRSFLAEFPRTPFGLFAAKSAGIKTWKDLYGKTVLVSAGSSETWLLPATFAKLGLDISKVHLVNTSPSGKAAAYIAGKGDAVGVDIPTYVASLGTKRPSNYLWFGDVLNVPFHGLFTTEAYMKVHPDVVRGFAAATVKAMQAMQQDPKAIDEAVADLIKANTGRQFDSAEFVTAWKAYQPFMTSPQTQGHPLGWQVTESWTETLDILQKYLNLKPGLKPSDLFTNDYLPQ